MASCFGLPCFVSRSWHSLAGAEGQCRPFFALSFLYRGLVRAFIFIDPFVGFRGWQLLNISGFFRVPFSVLLFSCCQVNNVFRLQVLSICTFSLIFSPSLLFPSVITSCCLCCFSFIIVFALLYSSLFLPPPIIAGSRLYNLLISQSDHYNVLLTIDHQMSVLIMRMYI